MKTKRPGKNPNRKEFDGDKVQIGEVFWDSKDEQIQLVLGDPTVPFGLWKAIQEMRKGERALIMVKPKFGYDHELYRHKVGWPTGWPTSDANINALRTRRTFFDVHLIDWVVKHDLLGEGSILKTISQRGTGYDRPEKHDELTISLKVTQTDRTLIDVKELDWTFDVKDHPLITPTTRKILSSMKLAEETSSLIKPEFI